MTEILVIFALVLFNGVLAGSEIAVVSMRKTRLRELIDEGSAGARAVQSLRESPERFLATVQIGITVVGATAGAFGGSNFAVHLVPAFQRLPWVSPYAEQLALAVVVALISYLSLVLGELVPKSLAMRASERYALLIGRPLVALSSLTRPLVWFLTASSNAVLRIFGDRTNFIESRLSIEELQQLVGEAAKAGTVHPQVGEIASRAIDFGNLTAFDVMIPRRNVVAIPLDASHDEIRRILLEHGHTRMPVYDGSIDNVVGYISAKDVLALAWEQKLIVLADLLRPPFFVPEVRRAADVLQDMRKRHLPFAIVVDEQGGFSGIITTEDLIEELVGELFSEDEEPPAALIRREPDGSAIVQGSAAIRDVNRELGLDLAEDAGSTTVGGLVVTLASRIPAPGERIEGHFGVVFEVIEASPRRVKAVRIRPQRPASK